MVKVRFIEPGEQLQERSVGENARTLTKNLHNESIWLPLVRER